MRKNLKLFLAVIFVFVSILVPQMTYASSPVGSTYSRPMYYEGVTSRSWVEVYETYKITSKHSGVEIFQKFCMDSWIKRGMTSQSYSTSTYSTWTFDGNVSANIKDIIKAQFGISYSTGSTVTQTYNFAPEWSKYGWANYANMMLVSINNRVNIEITTKKIRKDIYGNSSTSTTTNTITVYEPYSTAIGPVYRSSL